LWTAVLAAVALCLSQAQARPRRPSEIHVRPGKLAGTVTDSLGKSLVGIQLQLTRGGEVVADTRTDKKGAYAIENVAAGAYELRVGDWRAMPLIVEEGVTAETLQVVVPADRRYSSAALTHTQWIWIGVGVTAAATVAVAVPIAVSGGDGDHGRKTVSP